MPSKKQLKKQLQEMIYTISRNCWVCGESPDSNHHTPPRAANPKYFVKIPTCKKCHDLLNNIEYTKRQQRSLRSNIKRIEKSVKNIRKNILDIERRGIHQTV